mmetsp:Transcript_106495/g.318270  ORF Transcript_106495/g.318270 Transcript_106495/m.318270 type:complete len:258 (+) Transcript_106495:323-1096(+)
MLDNEYDCPTRYSHFQRGGADHHREALRRGGRASSHHLPRRDAYEAGPQEDKAQAGGNLWHDRASKFSPEELPAQVDDCQGNDGGTAEDEDAETDVFCLHHERGILDGGRVAEVPFRGAAFDRPIDRTDCPRQAEPEEDIDGVASCDVDNGGVRSRLLFGRGQGRKQVRHGGAERHEGERGHVVADPQDEAEELCQVRDPGRQATDEGQRDEETGPTVEEACGRHKRKDYLPWEGNDVQDPVRFCCLSLVFGAPIAV